MIFLVDNGSKRPDAYRSLCAIAAAFSTAISQTVLAAPLLHANKIPSGELDGKPAGILEDLIKDGYAKGERSFLIVPLFFGPSGAVTDYLPRRLKLLAKKQPEMSVRVLYPLFKSAADGGDILSSILCDRVMEVVSQNRMERYQVVLVDHGSPKREVTDVRNTVSMLLEKALLQKPPVAVEPASMERRRGPEYAFNEPLLETILKQPPFVEGNTIVAQLFLSPGRHAGPGGDIARVCESAEQENSRLRTYRTELMGTHPLLIKLLVRRWEERESTEAIRY